MSVADSATRRTAPGATGPGEPGSAAPTVVTGPGNPLETWSDALRGATRIPVSALAPAPGARLVVVSAHPDDEVLGAGRLVADWASGVGPVVAVTATAGEACVEHLGVQIQGLAARRVAEWTAAVTLLGASARACWGLPDGGLAAEQEGLAERLARACAPGDVLLAPWRHDPHPDHGAIGAAAATAAQRSGARLIEYPVWMTYWTQPAILEHSSFRLVRVATSARAEATRTRALREYRSQHTPLREDLTPVVPPEMLAHHGGQLALLPRGARRG